MSCDCTFDPDLEPEPDGHIPTPDEWHHYRRTCLHCGNSWWALHCRHDGHQKPCPDCGVRPTPVEFDVVLVDGEWKAVDLP